MTYLFVATCFVAAYLLGSIPTAVWLGKAFFNVDVRQHGSGNSGATNTFRVLGKRAGISVFLIDVSKGLLAGSLANFLRNAGLFQSDATLELLQIAFGMTSILGHIFSVFVHFKGGKGVACSLGLGICLHPYLALTCFFIFFVVLYVTHYVSVGSILSTLAFPVLTYTDIYFAPGDYITGFGFLAFLLVIYTHRTNIRKLYLGTENKIYLFKSNRIQA